MPPLQSVVLAYQALENLRRQCELLPGTEMEIMIDSIEEFLDNMKGRVDDMQSTKTSKYVDASAEEDSGDESEVDKQEMLDELDDLHDNEPRNIIKKNAIESKISPTVTNDQTRDVKQVDSKPGDDYLQAKKREVDTSPSMTYEWETYALSHSTKKPKH